MTQTANKHGFEVKQEVTIGGIAFTVIQTEAERVKVIASNTIGDRAFDAKNRNDFATSDIRAYLNGEFLQKLIEAGAPEEMFEEFEIDLTADDGLKQYGKDRARVGLITCDEYRALRDNIPPLPDTWWWTATPRARIVRYVGTGGTLYDNYAYYGRCGVRPLCVLKSEILVSYLDGDTKKRREAVDMMKHIAAAWNIKPEEVFGGGVTEMRAASIIDYIPEGTELVPQPKETVNHPAHYNVGKIECIDAMEAATADLSGAEAICTSNAIKYLWRWKHKGGVNDLKKAVWYINRLIQKLEGKP